VTAFQAMSKVLRLMSRVNPLLGRGRLARNEAAREDGSGRQATEADAVPGAEGIRASSTLPTSQK